MGTKLQLQEHQNAIVQNMREGCTTSAESSATLQSLKERAYHNNAPRTGLAHIKTHENNGPDNLMNLEYTVIALWIPLR